MEFGIPLLPQYADSLENGLVRWSPSHGILAANRALLDQLGCADLAELRERNSREVWADSGAPELLHRRALSSSDGRAQGELIFRRRDGQCLRAVAEASLERGGSWPGLTLILRFPGRPETLGIAPRAFLANISHELRTPINGVLGLSSVLVEKGLQDSQKELVEGIQQSGEILLSIVEDLLEFSCVQAGAVRLDRHSFRLEDIVETSLRSLREQAQAKGIALRSNFNGTHPDLLNGDPQRLQQILDRLLSNAIKFSDSGEVNLAVSATAEASGWRLAFVVEDEGVGLGRDDLDRIFKPFRQADESAARGYGGTGLGLSICRRLCHLMGGEISAEARSPRGSVFRFHVFCEDAAAGELASSSSAARPADPRSRSDRQPLRILVAEDNPVNQLVIGRLLEGLGYHPRLVGDGREALDALLEEEFDLFLVDIQMPRMDGLECIRRIHAGEIGSHRPVLVALTANASAQDRQRCLAAGMDDFLGKPLRRADLQATLGRVAANRLRSAEGIAG